MEPADLTVEILKGIRSELRGTNESLEGLRDDVHGTNGRLDRLRTEMHERLAETNDRLARLERRETETEVRLSTELVAVVGAVREVRDLLRDDHALRDRVDDHERRIAAVETRV
jgi:chromosome segregation ATPase